jgi:zinc D-Ala-D-Ala carboxypeptidase
MSELVWSDYPSFTRHEFECRFTGKCDMQPEFMEKLQQLRNEYNRPMVITSGFRSPLHPIEARKQRSDGEHTRGVCADIGCLSSRDRFELVRLALKHGFTRIGIAKNFVHIGLGGVGLPSPVMWDYQ